MEKRYKLSQKQFDTLKVNNKRVDLAQTALDLATRQLTEVSELILDFFGIPIGTKTRIDQATLEVITGEPEPAK